MLQTRNGKRTARAAIRVAYEMVQEGLISKEEALLRIDPEQLNQLLHRQIDPEAKLNVIARGLPASPGAALARWYSMRMRLKGLLMMEKVVLVRNETTPDDIHGILKAQGVLTARGGMTSHAAVVARGMGKPCVCGCEVLKINAEAGMFTVGGQTVNKGDIISIDGSTEMLSWARSR